MTTKPPAMNSGTLRCHHVCMCEEMGMDGEATSIGQWILSVCCSECHYSYTLIRIDILTIMARCSVNLGTFVPI